VNGDNTAISGYQIFALQKRQKRQQKKTGISGMKMIKNIFWLLFVADPLKLFIFSEIIFEMQKSFGKHSMWRKIIHPMNQCWCGNPAEMGSE
jgi:hypothetical protein